MLIKASSLYKRWRTHFQTFAQERRRHSSPHYHIPPQMCIARVCCAREKGLCVYPALATTNSRMLSVLMCDCVCVHLHLCLRRRGGAPWQSSNLNKTYDARTFTRSCVPPTYAAASAAVMSRAASRASAFRKTAKATHAIVHQSPHTHLHVLGPWPFCVAAVAKRHVSASRGGGGDGGTACVSCAYVLSCS